MPRTTRSMSPSLIRSPTVGAWGSRARTKIRQRSLVLCRGDGKAVEPRDPAEQHLPGESKPAEDHSASSPPASDSRAAVAAAGSPDSLLKSSRTPAISFWRRGSRPSEVVANRPIRARLLRRLVPGRRGSSDEEFLQLRPAGAQRRLIGLDLGESTTDLGGLLRSDPTVLVEYDRVMSHGHLPCMSRSTFQTQPTRWRRLFPGLLPSSGSTATICSVIARGQPVGVARHLVLLRRIGAD